MSWINIVWPMIAAACLTLALIHLGIWFKQRPQYAYLAFSILALTVASFAVFEWLLMRSETTQRYGALLRWLHVPVFVGTLALVGFVRFYFRAGRVWLAYAACGLRLLALILNFVAGVNLNYLAITTVRQLPILGDSVTVATGVPNPLQIVDELSLLALFAFVIDAWVAVWRRGDRGERRRAAVIFGSIVFFLLIAAGGAISLHRGLIYGPYMISLPFLVVLATMGYELVSNVFRAAQLAGRLQESEALVDRGEQRMDLAASAAGLTLWEWDIVRDEVWTTDQGRRFFGIGQHERIDLDSFLARVHFEDRDGIRLAVTESLQGGGDYEREFRITLPDGQTRWVTSRGRVRFDAAGAPALLRGVSLDITERKRLELEAVRQRDELTHLSRIAMLGELSGSLAHESAPGRGARDTGRYRRERQARR